MAIATYRLSDQSASFEFFPWLVMMIAKGATKIAIDPTNPKTNKMPLEEVFYRLKNILVPGAAFARVPVSVEARPGMIGYNKDFLNWALSGGKFKRLETVQPPISCDYTVTIRNHKRAICRNSNAPVWRQFAKEIGAIVIEDELDEPISLHHRMALYAGAKMNFGVCNGPTAMIGYTPYPLRQFVPNDSARNSLVKSGIPFGTERCPWMLPNQRLVWAEETIENMYRSML